MNTQVLEALSSFLEKAARPGVLGAPGRKLEKAATKDLASYFHELGSSVALLHLERHANLSKEEAIHAVKMSLANLLRKKQGTLLAILKANLSDAYQISAKLKAVAESFDLVEADDKSSPGDWPIDQLGPSGEAAAAYADANAAQLVRGIDETTMNSIADAVAQGIEDRLGVDGTGRLIRGVTDGFTTTRSEMIASTEINRAMSQATLDKLQALDFSYKAIILSPDACPVCIDNEDEGPIPDDQLFRSGDDAPPFHPNCRCALIPARAPSETSDDSSN